LLMVLSSIRGAPREDRRATDRRRSWANAIH
jgi:hypothetical protein